MAISWGSAWSSTGPASVLGQPLVSLQAGMNGLREALWRRTWSRGGWRFGHELAVCPWSLESILSCTQSSVAASQGGWFCPWTLHSGETPPWVLHSARDPQQKKCQGPVGLKWKEEGFRSVVREKLFIIRMVKHWNKLLSSVDAPSLETLKAGLDGALGSQVLR